MKTLLVTGSSGLVGSACVRHFHAMGWQVHGIDNNARQWFFGRDGDTSATLVALLRDCPGFRSHQLDVSAPGDVIRFMSDFTFDLIIHCAAQPSHDLAAMRPLDDWHTNATGTLHMLEAMRRYAPDAVFCFLSTNKVYGDAPNRIPRVELSQRYWYAWARDDEGVGEDCTIDQTTHSLFGVSKLAADLMVQEYGRSFGLKTVCFRAGCLTGGAHAGAEQHGFLAYLARCCREGRPYRVYGHKGKQVRDQLHASDVARACEEFYKAPRAGEVYNLGGGRANSVSVLEAIEMVQAATGKRLDWEYVDEPRKGDHVVYISDTRKFRSHYPGWSVSVSLDEIIAELCQACPAQSAGPPADACQRT